LIYGRAAGVGRDDAVFRRTWVGAEETSAFTLADAPALEELSNKADAGTLGGERFARWHRR